MKPAQTIITMRQAEALLAFFGGHDAEVAIAVHEKGLVAWGVDCPEEGSFWLGETAVDDELADKGRDAGAQQAEPEADELDNAIDQVVGALKLCEPESQQAFEKIKSALLANIAYAAALGSQFRAAQPCEQAAAARGIETLRGLLYGVGIVGQIDGHDVIRRLSVIDLVERVRRAIAGKSEQEAAR